MTEPGNAAMERKPKPWPLVGYAPGNYMCTCTDCDTAFIGDKRAYRCLTCAASKANAAFTAASLPPVEGEKTWQPIETAPLDGKHCILAVKEGAFIYSVQGAFHAGQWNAVYRDNVKPLCWMPNVRLPDEFLALADGGAES